MDKITFVTAINAYKAYDKTLDRASEFIEIDSPLVNFGWDMFNLLMTSSFSDDDVDFIYWWLHERESFGEINKAYYADGSEIKLDTVEDLWNYLNEDRPECTNS